MRKANDYLCLAYAKHSPDGKLDEQSACGPGDDLGPLSLVASCREKFASSAIAGRSITIERTTQLKVEETALDGNSLLHCNS